MEYEKINGDPWVLYPGDRRFCFWGIKKRSSEWQVFHEATYSKRGCPAAFQRNAYVTVRRNSQRLGDDSVWNPLQNEFGQDADAEPAFNHGHDGIIIPCCEMYLGCKAVLIGIFLVNGYGAAAVNRFGILCGLASAVMYAFMVIFNKKAAAITGLENSVLQLFIAFAAVAVFVGFKQGFLIDIPAESFIPVLVLGLLNTGIGCYLYFSSIGKIPVQTVAICGYLEPLSAVLFSVIFLNEKLLPLQIIGAVLIIGGAIRCECSGK